MPTMEDPDPAILGWVRTRDPDPGHFGPDFDFGSGHGSAFTDPGSGCLPESTDVRDFTDCFTDLQTLFGLKFYLKKICSLALEEGGTACEIWIKTRKIVGSAVLLLNCAQVFTRVEGGDRRPQSVVWRVGVSWQIVTKPL